MNSLKCFLASSLLISQVACSSIKVQKYAGQTPEFNLQEFFNGKLEAHGIFQDRSGVVIKRMYCEISARWDGDTGIIDEVFTYSDGTKSTRTWQMKKMPDGSYVGTAGDVIGQAIATSAGYAFNMKYTLSLPVDGKVYNVSMDDWMYRMNEKVVVNKTEMSKWGFHLGDVTLTIVKK